MAKLCLFLLAILTACARPTGETSALPSGDRGRTETPPVTTPRGSRLNGAGSSGGGQGTTVNGRLHIREFVEGITCRWEEGPAVYERSRQFQKIRHLVRFFFSDEGMERGFEREIVGLHVCFSAQPLRELPEESSGDVTPYRRGATQIAIRIENEIFLDERAFRSLDEKEQGYFLLHELLHGFIPMDTPARMTRLRDFVAGFRALEAQLPEDVRNVATLVLLSRRADEREKRELVARLNAAFRRLMLDCAVDPSRHPVTRYLFSGNVEALRILFREGANPNARGSSGDSFFHEMLWELRQCDIDDIRAYCRRLPEIVGAYLDAGARPDDLFDNHEGWQPRPAWEYLLSTYAQRGKIRRIEMAELLFRRLTIPRARLETLLLDFSRNPFLGRAAGKLLDWGAGIEARNATGQTPLIIAATRGAGEGVRFRRVPPPAHLIAVLIKYGADISARDSDGKTALEHLEADRRNLAGDARHLEQFEIASRLLTAGRAALGPAVRDLVRLGWPEP